MQTLTTEQIMTADLHPVSCQPGAAVLLVAGRLSDRTRERACELADIAVLQHGLPWSTHGAIEDELRILGHVLLSPEVANAIRAVRQQPELGERVIAAATKDGRIYTGNEPTCTVLTALGYLDRARIAVPGETLDTDALDTDEHQGHLVSRSCYTLGQSVASWVTMTAVASWVTMAGAVQQRQRQLQLRPCDPAYHWCAPGCGGYFVVCGGYIVAHGVTPAAAQEAARQPDNSCDKMPCLQGCGGHHKKAAPNIPHANTLPRSEQPLRGLAYGQYEHHGTPAILCRQHAEELSAALDEYEFYSVPIGTPCEICESQLRAAAERVGAYAEDDGRFFHRVSGRLYRTEPSAILRSVASAVWHAEAVEAGNSVPANSDAYQVAGSVVAAQAKYGCKRAAEMPWETAMCRLGRAV